MAAWPLHAWGLQPSDVNAEVALNNYLTNSCEVSHTAKLVQIYANIDSYLKVRAEPAIACQQLPASSKAL